MLHLDTQQSKAPYSELQKLHEQRRANSQTRTSDSRSGTSSSISEQPKKSSHGSSETRISSSKGSTVLNVNEPKHKTNVPYHINPPETAPKPVYKAAPYQTRPSDVTQDRTRPSYAPYDLTRPSDVSYDRARPPDTQYDRKRPQDTQIDRNRQPESQYERAYDRPNKQYEQSPNIKSNPPYQSQQQYKSSIITNRPIKRDDEVWYIVWYLWSGVFPNIVYTISVYMLTFQMDVASLYYRLVYFLYSFCILVDLFYVGISPPLYQ